MLQNLEVLTSDCISKSVSIAQPDPEKREKLVTISLATANFHLLQDGDKLKIYLSKSKKLQRLCFSNELPVKILKHLGARRLSYSAQLGLILKESKLFVINELLQQTGIIDLDGVKGSDENDDDDEAGSSEDDRSIHPTSASPSSAFSLAARTRGYTPWYMGTPGFHGSQSIPRVNTIEDAGLMLNIPGYKGQPIPQNELNHYTQLLNAVIQQAVHLSNIPAKGDIIRGSGFGIDVNQDLALRSSYLGEKEFKIGAAGELFVSTPIQWHTT